MEVNRLFFISSAFRNGVMRVVRRALKRIEFHPEILDSFKAEDYVFSFFVYSFIGWSVESFYRSVGERRLLNSGFLNGPMTPIYGTGATVMSVLLSRHYKNPLFVLGLGMISCDTVEYITSFLMEKLFHKRWWDYSDYPMNLNGRICMRHTIMWGVASVAFVYLVQPVYLRYFVRVPKKARDIMLGAAFAVFIIDLIDTVRKAVDTGRIIERIDRMKETVSDAAGRFADNADDAYLTLALGLERGGMKAVNRVDELSEQLDELGSELSRAFAEFRGNSQFMPRRITGFSRVEDSAKNALSDLKHSLSALKDRFESLGE